MGVAREIDVVMAAVGVDDLKELPSAHGDQLLRCCKPPVVSHNATDQASPKKHIRPL